MHSNAMSSGASGRAESYDRAEASRPGRRRRPAAGRAERPGRRDPRGHGGPAAGIPAGALGLAEPASRRCQRRARRRRGRSRRSCARTCPTSARTAPGGWVRRRLPHLPVSRALGLTQHYSVVIIGVGNLGQALAGYGGFGTRGFRVAALVDADRGYRVGSVIAGVEVRHVDELEAILTEHEVSIGVIATPAGGAGGLQPPGACRRHQRPELRTRRAVGARGCRRTQGRSVDRAADPRLPRAAQVRRPAGSPENAGTPARRSTARVTQRAAKG